jgi:hypothetical protein
MLGDDAKYSPHNGQCKCKKLRPRRPAMAGLGHTRFTVLAREERTDRVCLCSEGAGARAVDVESTSHTPA